MSSSSRKLNSLATPDNFQIYQGKSLNGFITRNYYYKNGIKCDALGQVPGDPGFNPENTDGQFVPITYPFKNEIIKTSGKKKKYPQRWGLDSSDVLELKKQNVENSVRNVTRTNILNNKRTKWEKKNGFSYIYPPKPSFSPFPSNKYIIPTSYRKVYYVFPWARV